MVMGWSDPDTKTTWAGAKSTAEARRTPGSSATTR